MGVNHYFCAPHKNSGSKRVRCVEERLISFYFSLESRFFRPEAARKLL